jgi:transposase
MSIKLPGQHNRAIGEEFVNLIDEAFRNYRQWQFSRDALSYNDWAQQFQTKVQLTLNRWIEHAGATAGNLLRNLHQKAKQWWYFLNHPEVPPDNNLAERSLRLAVTKRKVSGGSRSMERFQHTANLLTVVQTCRRQGRSVINFFVQALKAHSGSSFPGPSLMF